MLQGLLLGLVAAVAEILGGVLVVNRAEWPKRVQEYLLALSAGFLLALAFMKLIPESMKLLGPAASISILAGFGMMHFFEHAMVGHLHFGEETHSDVMLSKVASVSAFSGLVVHAFFDGFSIAAGVSYDLQTGLLVFFAILLHKLPEGVTIATVMIAARQSRRNAFLASAAIGFATMAGVCSVLVLKQVNAETVGIAFALSGGIATYVGASDLIPEINRSGNRITPLFVLGGMLLFYISDIAVSGLVAP